LCVEGPASVVRRDAWRVAPEEYRKQDMAESNVRLLDWLVRELLKMASVPHPNTRQAVCAYLLSITKRLAHVEVLKELQSSVQSAFMDLLSENNGMLHRTLNFLVTIFQQDSIHELDKGDR